MKIRNAHQKGYIGHISFVRLINTLKYFRNIKPRTYQINYLRDNILVLGYKKENKILALYFFRNFNSWQIQINVYETNTKNIFVKNFWVIVISDKDYENLNMRYVEDKEFLTEKF